MTGLAVMLITPRMGLGQSGLNPAMGLRVDPGFPIWLGPDPVDYLPLVADQTSGLDWVGSDTTPSGDLRQWLLLADDIDTGGIHLVNVESTASGPKIAFHSELTLPPPEILGLPIAQEHGYDWEAISLHPWSGTVFIAQEGSRDEIGIYLGLVSPGDGDLADGAFGRTGSLKALPGHISNLKRLEFPGWDEAFGQYLSDNRGIEGIACTSERLFVGLESPYEFTQRLLGEKSTILAIWKIDPENPANMENCELLEVHDTSEWASSLGYTVETICGLDAIDDTHLVGIDRDNQRLFAVQFTESGLFTGGRLFYLDTPGPAPLPEDDCPPLDHPPVFIKPSLESVAVVPLNPPTDSSQPVSYHIYLAVDPWGPGWTLADTDWDCPAYEKRLSSLLPALYRYTVDFATLFPG